MYSLTETLITKSILCKMATLLQEAMISLESKMGEHFKSLQDAIGKIRLEMHNMGQNMVDTFNQQMNILDKGLDNRVTVLEDKTNERINHVESCVKDQISKSTEKIEKEIEVVQEICKSQEREMEVYGTRAILIKFTSYRGLKAAPWDDNNFRF